jgi:transcription elongation factor Elf1
MDSTTKSILQVIGFDYRKPQDETVRLLARNVPPEYECTECGRDATDICTTCANVTDNPFYCPECGDMHEHDSMMPISNSPRMGVHGYDGMDDIYI